MTPRVTAPMLLLAIVLTTPAAAQPANDGERNQSIGIGGQWAAPHTLRGEAPGVQISWRRWLSPHIGVSTDFRWWTRSTTTDFPALAQQEPARETRGTASYGFGVGLLGRMWSGRVSAIGGIGPGFFVDRTTYERQVSDRRDSGGHAHRTIGVQSVLEIDVRLTNRLSGFAGLRMELRDFRDSESSSGYPTVGLRFAF
jgi:hypothetical protein